MSNGNKKYFHILDDNIINVGKTHPFNDKNNINLSNKLFYIEELAKDLKLNKDSIKNISEINNKNKSKQNLFKIDINNYKYNIFIEHTDDGGKEYDKKVSLPFNNISFRKLVNDIKNVLVANIYYALKNVNNELVIDYEKYVYLIVSAKKIYSSEVAHNIWNNEKSNSSSRWVNINEILLVLKNKNVMSNKKGTVWIVHPNNIKDFITSIGITEYKNQFIDTIKELSRKLHSNKIDLEEEKNKIQNARTRLRNKIINKKTKCQIKGCEISDLSVLIVSHIWAVNEILLETEMNIEEKIKYIEDENNALLLCATHDALFDRHLISFDREGKLLVSKKIKKLSPYNLESKVKYIDVFNEINNYLIKHREKFNNQNEYYSNL
ncbi:MAG: HNH endonuclease [Metamycoplasmataceae bacterium]